MPTLVSGWGWVTGPTGPTGPIGPSGVSGPKGSSGFAGAVGPTGPSGFRGIPGANLFFSQGVNGISGPTGPTGPQGLAGPFGYSGIKGITGSSGVFQNSTLEDLYAQRNNTNPQGWWIKSGNPSYLDELSIGNERYLKNWSFWGFNAKNSGLRSILSGGIVSGYSSSIIESGNKSIYFQELNISSNYLLQSSLAPRQTYLTKIKNVGNQNINVTATQIIFYYGSPGLGSPQILATIAPNQIGHFEAQAIGNYVSWYSVSPPQQPWKRKYEDFVFAEDDIYILSNSGKYYGEAITIQNRSQKPINFYYPNVGTNLQYNHGSYSFHTIPALSARSYAFGGMNGGMYSQNSNSPNSHVGIYNLISNDTISIENKGWTHLSYDLVDWNYYDYPSNIMFGKLSGSFTSRISSTFVTSGIGISNAAFLTGNPNVIELAPENYQFFFEGSSGPRGALGPSGFNLSGHSGPRGVSGPMGAIGLSGFSGVSGPSGPVGLAGLTGEVGLPTSGARGLAGPNGLIGFKGDAGISGSNGFSQAFPFKRVLEDGSSQIIISPRDAYNTYLNGQDLLNIYEANKSADKNIDIILLPGVYSLSEPLQLTSNFIRIKGLTKNPRDVIITCNYSCVSSVIQKASKIHLENLTIQNGSYGDPAGVSEVYRVGEYDTALHRSSFSNEYTNIKINVSGQNKIYKKIIESNGENAFIGDYPISGDKRFALVRKPLSISEIQLLDFNNNFHPSGNLKVWKHISFDKNTQIFSGASGSFVLPYSPTGEILSFENPPLLTGFSSPYDALNNHQFVSWPWEVSSWKGQSLNVELEPINSYIKNVNFIGQRFALPMASHSVYGGEFIDCFAHGGYAFGGMGGFLTGKFVNCSSDGLFSFTVARFENDFTMRGVTMRKCEAQTICFGALGRIDGDFIDLTIKKTPGITGMMGTPSNSSVLEGISINNL